jgi:hypothetical protein
VRYLGGRGIYLLAEQLGQFVMYLSPAWGVLNVAKFRSGGLLVSVSIDSEAV